MNKDRSAYRTFDPADPIAYTGPGTSGDLVLGVVPDGRVWHILHAAALFTASGSGSARQPTFTVITADGKPLWGGGSGSMAASSTWLCQLYGSTTTTQGFQTFAYPIVAPAGAKIVFSLSAAQPAVAGDQYHAGFLSVLESLAG